MGNKIDSDAVHYGRNRDQREYQPDDRYVRCWNCNFIAHLDRDRRAPEGSRVGEGIRYVNLDGIYDSPVDMFDQPLLPYDGYKNLKDPVVFMGCPQCGCLTYDK